MATILIVDDNEFNRDLLGRRLKRKNFLVLCALDSQTCFELLQTKQPDLVLLDLHLPGMNGWDIARHLKQHETFKHIPIIGVSAHRASDAKLSALDAGCDDYESKPIDFQQLLGKINALLGT